jgi:hypothetical protein
MAVAILGISHPTRPAQASSCVWKQEVKAMGYTTGGCDSNTTISNESSCSQPAPSLSDSSVASNVCCCPVVNTGQVNCNWDGDYANHTACTGGYKTDDSKCSGTKPTDFSNVQCCCIPVTTTQTTAQTTAAAPTFIIPQFQIPINVIKLTTPTYTGSEGNYTYSIPWIAEYIQGIYTYGLSIAGILAAIVLMAGGLLWLVSAGDASKITQAKELITGSITGLVILASSYIILTQINPNLTQLIPITLGNIKKAEFQLLAAKSNSTANSYRDATCATDDELQNGVQFYATGYYKAPWGTSHHDLCMIAMQCTCPDLNGDKQPDIDTSSDCSDVFPNFKTSSGQPYRPCKAFPQGTTYCNQTASGKAPYIGSIAGPSNCSNLPYKTGTTQVCFKGKTYTILDTGGAIKGRRIDIWSSSLDEANAQTGVGTLTKGACK